MKNAWWGTTSDCPVSRTNANGEGSAKSAYALVPVAEVDGVHGRAEGDEQHTYRPAANLPGSGAVAGP